MKALLVLLALCGTAAAHDVRGEVLLLDIGNTAIDLEVRTPVMQLEKLTRLDQLRPYAAQRLGATAADGRPFGIEIGAITRERVGDGDVAILHAHLTAPAGDDARWFELRDDLLLDQITSDTVYVFLRSDLQTGVLDAEPRLIGYLHYQARTLVVDRDSGSLARSFLTVFRLGIDHIATGTDHLMFLLVLLIPAPLLAMGGRWAGRRSGRQGLWATAGIATAFTLGHSLTLAIGALHGPLLPVRFVEVAIAVSILVTAVHALRPLFAGREALIAAMFGLVHGLAFATSLAGVGVDGTSLVVGVLGFNLGVEAMQLVVLLLTVPALIALSRTRAYASVRVAAALVAVGASLYWITTRL